MKYLVPLVVATCIAGLSGNAQAREEWQSRQFESGETVYKIGHFDKFFVGERGVGFKTNNHLHDPVAVTVSIDGSKPEVYQIEKLLPISTYIFKDSKGLLPRVMKAKTIELSFRVCMGLPFDCMFTKTGESYSVTWTPETPLAEALESGEITKRND